MEILVKERNAKGFAMVRENNIKIIPLCPFAAAMFRKTVDIKDVLKS
jgi:predicted GNAT family acetyltransferase